MRTHLYLQSVQYMGNLGFMNANVMQPERLTTPWVGGLQAA